MSGVLYSQKPVNLKIIHSSFRTGVMSMKQNSTQKLIDYTNLIVSTPSAIRELPIECRSAIWRPCGRYFGRKYVFFSCPGKQIMNPLGKLLFNYIIICDVQGGDDVSQPYIMSPITFFNGNHVSRLVDYIVLVLRL